MIKYSVVIPERNEKDNFEKTKQNILNTQKNCNEVIHIEDLKGYGTSYSRHLGVMQAQNNIIITCDAHMRFKQNALDNMADYIADSEDALACLKCYHNANMSFDEACYYGADLLWVQEEKNNDRVLSAVWRKSNSCGEIASVMGACYGFKKTSYDKIGQPWRLGVAWGLDEETISMAIRLIGGKVELLDYECAHLLKHKSNYHLCDKDYIGVWYNRIRNLYYLPIDIDTCAELHRIVMNNSNARKYAPQIDLLLRSKMKDINESKKILMTNLKVSFEDYATQWITGYMAKKTIKKTELKTCENVVLKVKKDDEMECPHCHVISNCKMTNFYPFSKRYICGICEHPFIIMNTK